MVVACVRLSRNRYERPLTDHGESNDLIYQRRDSGSQAEKTCPRLQSKLKWMQLSPPEVINKPY